MFLYGAVGVTALCAGDMNKREINPIAYCMFNYTSIYSAAI